MPCNRHTCTSPIQFSCIQSTNVSFFQMLFQEPLDIIFRFRINWERIIFNVFIDWLFETLNALNTVKILLQAQHELLCLLAFFINGEYLRVGFESFEPVTSLICLIVLTCVSCILSITSRPHHATRMESSLWESPKLDSFAIRPGNSCYLMSVLGMHLHFTVYLYFFFYFTFILSLQFIASPSFTAYLYAIV